MSLFANHYQIQTKSILHATLSALSLRHSAISQNITNVDTPYYKRKDVMFEDYLRKALYDPPEVRSSRPDGRHAHFSTEIVHIRPAVFAETDSRYRNDDNNVDIDREMAILSKNQLTYTGIVGILGSLNSTMQSVLAAR